MLRLFFLYEKFLCRPYKLFIRESCHRFWVDEMITAFSSCRIWNFNIATRWAKADSKRSMRHDCSDTDLPSLAELQV